MTDKNKLSEESSGAVDFSMKSYNLSPFQRPLLPPLYYPFVKLRKKRLKEKTKQPKIMAFVRTT